MRRSWAGVSGVVGVLSVLLMVVVVAASAYREQVSAATQPNRQPVATETMPTYKVLRYAQSAATGGFGGYQEAKVDGYALVRFEVTAAGDAVLVFERWDVYQWRATHAQALPMPEAPSGYGGSEGK